MKFLITLSKEHPNLPLMELKSVLEGGGLKYKLADKGEAGVLLAVTGSDESFLKRLAFSKTAVKIVGKQCDGKNLIKLEKIISDGSFRVSSSDKEVERSLGARLGSCGLKVDLVSPDFNVVVKDGFVGIDIPLNRDFNSRKPQHRPFFHPTSMHPKFARVLVNLAQVKAGDMVFDPFCGTGGILIEAGLIGMRLSGCDVDQQMVSGCKKNLGHYGLSGEVDKADALTHKTCADAIVTDPPYGRSSYMTGKDAQQLFKKFITHAAETLPPGKRMVLVAPSQYKLEFPKFKVDAHYDIRMHKSLTRRIWVTKKI